MYQSNQARIKKEIPSLLPGCGQRPRGRPPLALAALAAAVNSTRGTVARPSPPLPLDSLLSILAAHNNKHA
jgi:hypothetical protein